MFTLNQFAPELDEEGNLLSERQDANAYASNASAGTSKAYDSAAAAPANVSNSGFAPVSPINEEEEYGKPEKTSYPEEDVAGRF